MVARRLGATLALLCAANFMVILDAQVVVLALPSITRDIGFPGGGAHWVLTAYLLSFGGLLLLGGRAGDLLGRRTLFMAGTALFVGSSLLCGLAWAGWVLVFARVLQGVSAAAMAPSALSLLMVTFPEGQRRNRALAVWSATGGFGATAALLIGGGLTDSLGWEWIFFLNIPVAVGLFGLSPVLLPESRERGARTFDLAGALTVTSAFAVLIYGVVEAPSRGWVSWWTLGPLAVAMALAGSFVVIERRSAVPLVPLRIFRSRGLTGGNLVMLLAAMIVFGVSYLVSGYAQQVLGYHPLVFGLAAAPLPVLAVFGAGTGQAMAQRFGSGPVAGAGFGFLGAGGLLLARAPTDGVYVVDLLPGLSIVGFGIGMATVAGPVAALSGVRERDSGLASGINTAAFQLGGALGVAVASTVVLASHGFGAGFAVTAGLGLLGVLVAVALLSGAQSNEDVHKGGEHAVPVADRR